MKGNGGRVYTGINTENAPPCCPIVQRCPFTQRCPPPPVSAASFSAGNCGQDILSKKIPEVKNSQALNDFFLTKYVVIIVLVD